MILDCDENIGRLYRKLYELDHYGVQKLHRPSWESHITVVRDEEPPRKELWDRHAGLVVEFDYFGPICDNGEYFWLNVKCDRLHDLREELGLARSPYFPLHLSVGHCNA